MSPTPPRRIPGTVPAAFSRNGQDVPPSPDVAEHTIAQVIGQAVAQYLGELLGPVLAHLANQQPMPACVLCVQARKIAEAEHRVAVANAAAAAEPEPELMLPPVTRCDTWMPMGQPPVAVPICYGHVPDGPAIRATGLVAPNGSPIIARS